MKNLLNLNKIISLIYFFNIETFQFKAVKDLKNLMKERERERESKKMTLRYNKQLHFLNTFLNCK